MKVMWFISTAVVSFSFTIAGIMLGGAFLPIGIAVTAFLLLVSITDCIKQAKRGKCPIIDNVYLRNVEIRAFDRYEHLEDDILEMRGHYIFSLKNASNVTLDNVRLKGDFAQKKARTEFVGCDDVRIKECVFG